MQNLSQPFPKPAHASSGKEARRKPSIKGKQQVTEKRDVCRALLDLYHNVCFNLNQLIKILHCDLQVTIHEGLVEVQADILKAIANIVDNFYIKVTTLSAPQVRALLNHVC